MIVRQSMHRITVLTALAITLSVAGLLANKAAAAEWDKVDSAVKLIPDDAAFYSSMLRGREQFMAVRQSNAWKKVENMPVVQMALSMYRSQLSNESSGPAQFEKFLKNPETQKVVQLLTDMVGEEVFAYGDDSCIDFLELFQNITGSINTPYAHVTVENVTKTPRVGLPATAAMAELARSSDLIAVPNFVMGFKLKNSDLAKEELIKLEMMANVVFEMNEKTKGHFKKTKVANHDYLVLSLDGEMLPWDEMPLDQFKDAEAHEGDAQKIINRLKSSKLVIALGVRDNYLLASFGSSLECVEKLGQGKRLIDRAEFKPLAKFADRRLTSIGYVSEEFNKQVNNQRQQIDNALKMVDKLLPLAKLSVTQNERIRKDAATLADDIKRLLPKLGAQTGLSFLSERGIESCTYAWGDYSRLDSSKPLGLLQHVGGNPILAVVARAKTNVADYDLMVKWVKLGFGYVEEFALPNAPPAEREKFTKFMTAAKPLLARLDRANREMLIPALADGQSAVVIDSKLASKQFVKAMPAFEKEMPMVEPAIVMGVSDAKLLKKGLGEYRQAINGLIDAVRQIEGSKVPPEVRIPEPQVTTSGSATLYSFALPKEWGVDAKIVPTFGLSEDVAVVSASRGHAERLLRATSPAGGQITSVATRPLAVAAWFDWAALVQAATPWIDFAIDQAATANHSSDAEKKTIAEQVHIGIDVAKAVQSITAESYLEDGALVNHATLEIHDVAK